MAAIDDRPVPGTEPDSAVERAIKPLFDLGAMDLSRRELSRAQIERWNPHRGPMALLDWIVWTRPDFTESIGLKHVGLDEFWVSGHFPGTPMMPGVLQIEAGAQLACYLFNVRRTERVLAVFLRIEQASFRSPVLPGDDLYLLCKEVKHGRRRFISDIQGVVAGRIAFDARVSGMARTDPHAKS